MFIMMKRIKIAFKLNILFSLCLNFLLFSLVGSFRFSSVSIPALVQRGANFWLVCRYQFDEANDDQLYSVKWYKNNEEFYRLQFDILYSNELNITTSFSQQQQQQQYFSQIGVNVLMSASNSTHVRLLNASLESEGLYACEISTQNLSTIRYEKEIKLYVLPSSKLNVIGFKGRYSLGDQVDLLCSSDFSRPRAALAWLINNQRITASKSSSHSSWFELESVTKSKLNEPSLYRTNLSLKFKLTAEFLETFGIQTSWFNQRNQSNLFHLGSTFDPSKAKLVSSEAYQISTKDDDKPNRKLELRFQCSYKLTEISDVSFNELVIVGGDGNKLAQLSDRHLSKRLSNQNQLKVTKLPAGQVSQTRNANSLSELSSALRRSLSELDLCPTSAFGASVNSLGSLALLPEDPLILASETNDGQLSVNCSTVGGVLADLGRVCAESGVGRHRPPPTEELSPRRPSARRSQQQLHAYLALTSSKWASLAVGESANSAARAAGSPQQQQLAPPLLEWFINNQEAPRNNARYSPELPILVSSKESSLKSYGLNEMPYEQSLALPSIDYADYFANFNSKPIEQNLMLHLKLDKSHFMTPDSNLRLRCSSTQAHVLASDSVTFTIIAYNSNDSIPVALLSRSNVSSGGWMQKSQMHYKPKIIQQASSAAADSQNHLYLLIVNTLILLSDTILLIIFLC